MSIVHKVIGCPSRYSTQLALLHCPHTRLPALDRPLPWTGRAHTGFVSTSTRRLLVSQLAFTMRHNEALRQESIFASVSIQSFDTDSSSKSIQYRSAVIPDTPADSKCFSHAASKPPRVSIMAIHTFFKADEILMIQSNSPKSELVN